MVAARIPPRKDIAKDTPLRLDVAAKLAFPDGTMSAAGLKRENSRGRLVVSRIAGKDYTTLADIDHMRELCRLQAKARDSGSDQPAEIAAAPPLTPPCGSSATEITRKARDAASTIVRGLKVRSPRTSPGSTSGKRAKGAVVIPLASRSRTS